MQFGPMMAQPALASDFKHANLKILSLGRTCLAEARGEELHEARSLGDAFTKKLQH
jgi:hypothetical protein